MRLRIHLMAACLACASLAPVARADLITFDGHSNTIFGDENTGNGLQPGVSDGFSFVSSGDHFHFAAGFGPSSPTSFLVEDRNYSITMTKVGGGSFNLLAADISEYVDGSVPTASTALSVTGFFTGGGSINTVINFDGTPLTFQNAIFAGFTGLSSVTFDATGGSGGFALENIQVSAVPVPAGLALAGFGLAGAFVMRRRFKGMSPAAV